MPQGPENRMLNRLKPKLERDLNAHIEKTNNSFRGGRPDWDVFGEDGNAGYIEAKHWPRQAKHGEVVDAKYIWEMATPLQQKWLREKANLGHKCAMLCGFNTKDCYAFFAVCPDGRFRPAATVYAYPDLLNAIQQWLYPNE